MLDKICIVTLTDVNILQSKLQEQLETYCQWCPQQLSISICFILSFMVYISTEDCVVLADITTRHFHLYISREPMKCTSSFCSYNLEIQYSLSIFSSKYFGSHMSMYILRSTNGNYCCATSINHHNTPGLAWNWSIIQSILLILRRIRRYISIITVKHA